MREAIEKVIAEFDDWQHFYLMRAENEAANAIKQAQDKLKEVLADAGEDREINSRP